MMNRLQHLDATRQMLLEEEHCDKRRALEVFYIWGKTGVGKTRFVMDKYGYTKVFRVTNYAHPFDGYKGQSVILFDEFRSSLPIADMLNYLDGYPLMLPCRYADKVACFSTIYFASNIPLEKQYQDVPVVEPETYRAFLRRIHHVFELLGDDPDAPF